MKTLTTTHRIKLQHYITESLKNLEKKNCISTLCLYTVPTAVRRAMRGEVSDAAIRRYRDLKAGRNDGIYAPGTLRMREDLSRRLLPGERQVWDDAS